jgi:hypothetical protein
MGGENGGQQRIGINAVSDDRSMPGDEPWPKGTLFRKWMDEGMAA